MTFKNSHTFKKLFLPDSRVFKTLDQLKLQKRFSSIVDAAKPYKSKIYNAKCFSNLFQNFKQSIDFKN